MGDLGKKSLSILGSTGSVGTSTVDVIKAHPNKFDVQVLTAYSNVELLAAQARELGAAHCVIGDEAKYNALKDALSGTGITASAGRQAIIDAAARPVDFTMCAIVGMAGLEPLMQSIRHGRIVAIANKEPLVGAGRLVIESCRTHGATLLPVDSEHNAVFQIFENGNRAAIEKIVLTASGGPFRTWSTAQMAKATPEQAIAHPNWTMGAKISVDSASMMNKALEVIEAHYLFALPPAQIGVIVHPQSTVHAFVEYCDGSVLAQLGAPDMKTPITNALGWPERLASPGQRLDWTKMRELTFEEVDRERFPSVKLAYDCLALDEADVQVACVALNAANEEAVASFLNKSISFGDIMRINAGILETLRPVRLDTLADILDFDTDIRARTKSVMLKDCA